MKPEQRSLRTKIIIWYAAGVLSIVAFILFNWNNLGSVREMDSSGDVVSELYDTTLEIRRYEKNFFLYRTDEDKAEIFAYVGDADELLGREELLLFTDAATIDGISGDLGEYQTLVQEDTPAMDAGERQQLEARIREKGKGIVESAEALSVAGNTVKSDALGSAQRNMMIGTILILSAGILGGVYFYRKAVKPLATIEGHMQRITDGEFSLIEERFNDRELISLKDAFNKMIVELQGRQEELVQSEKLASIGTLMFGIAHEINNPLSNISTSSQILTEEIESENIAYKKELLGQIEEETDRARDVVSSMLEYTRSRDQEVFSLRGAVIDTIRLLRADLPEGIRIHVGVDDDLELYADKQKIQRVILNLLQNAIDAIRGPGEIEIAAQSLNERGNKVMIVVSDNGAGMEQEMLSKVFDPFFSSKVEGHGLGLFIVHNIIEEHGGKISLESNPGQGTSYTIVLPAKES